MSNVAQYITISKEEYDNLHKAANALMLILNTNPVYMDKTAEAAKKAIWGPDSIAEPARAEISE